MQGMAEFAVSLPREKYGTYCHFHVMAVLVQLECHAVCLFFFCVMESWNTRLK